MTRRSRTLWFGSAAVLVAAGTICAVAVGGLTGQVLGITLITVGLGEALLLIFLEVGLSEDRERARDEDRRSKRADRHRDPRRRSPLRRRPR